MPAPNRRRTQRVTPAKPNGGFELLSCESGSEGEGDQDSDDSQGETGESPAKIGLVFPRVPLIRHAVTLSSSPWTPRVTGQATPKKSWADTDSDEEG